SGPLTRLNEPGLPATTQGGVPSTAAQVRKAMDANVRLGLILIAALVLGLGGVSAFIGNAGGVVAHGGMGAATHPQNGQHPRGGVVSQILVRDGQHVRAGDVLIRFDPTTVGASYTIVSDAVAELRAKQARLLAERDGLNRLVFPADLQARTA